MKKPELKNHSPKGTKTSVVDRGLSRSPEKVNLVDKPSDTHKQELEEDLIEKIARQTKELAKLSDDTLKNFEKTIRNDQRKEDIEIINNFKGEEYTDKEIWDNMKRDILGELK